MAETGGRNILIRGILRYALLYSGLGRRGCRLVLGQDEGAALQQVVVGQERPFPSLAGGLYRQRLTIGQVEGVAGHHRGTHDIEVLAGHGVETQHIEHEPRRHRSAVVVAGQSVGGVIVVVADDLVDTLHTPLGAVHPVVEVGCQKTRFVGHVIVVVGEEGVETLDERVLAAARRHQSRHIVGDAQAILGGEGFVEEGAPPGQVPRGYLRVGPVGNCGVVHLRLAPRHVVEPSSLRIARHDETAHPLPFVVAAPQVLPVAGALEVFPVEVVVSQTLGHLGDAPVVVAVLHGAVAGAVDAVGDVAQRVVFPESATAVLLVGHTAHIAVVVGGRHLGILDHGL